ncbi:TPA: hypothetical protein NO409_001844 [Salmonella enterica]|nr:hypothetical protein [Salmonella enterica subsp. enterica serovar Typhimurium]EEE3935356.1 hypothetical protein [Salmonella enterica subsp. enterica serovar Infantis]EHN5199533.1 hypothetical protein [Salmonella enterica subsp. enterica serovar Minnesota]HBK1079427.1 hypothetical protein [Salmonella enterica]EHW4540929.1 hypothetical protein [Salmonella enterica subsp. enterica serovar Minnesota]
MTTNNHPAHGPVSLDRLHQISEILSKASAQSNGGNLGYAMADAVKVIDGAIAEFGAEPVPFDALRDAVAEVSGGPVMEWSDIYKGHQAVPFINFNSLARIVDKFRIAQPVPVVPDELLSAMGEVLRISDRDHEAWHKARNGIAYFRAAMLQAGNSPVSPDGYVLVPIEPTPGMMVAGTLVSEFQADPAGMYRAMIAAAPQQEGK